MADEKKAIITGAAGFVGYHLTRALSESGYHVDAIVRPGSDHNERLKGLPSVRCIEADVGEMENATAVITEDYDCFFHLLWRPADRYDYETQMVNAYYTIQAVDLAFRVRCRRFIGIGSQAEYGSTRENMIEDKTPTRPFCAYGAAKSAACHLSRRRAKELGMEWVWGRVFSVYGEYEPKQRLIPHIISALENQQEVTLSSCNQNWDFLYGSDAGSAILSMAERGRDGEIYNIADGRYRSLRSFVKDIENLYDARGFVKFGEDPEPFVSLQPSIEKLQKDTGWKPCVRFEDGIRAIIKR